jgi:DNA-binding NtrC family response regulator
MTEAAVRRILVVDDEASLLQLIEKYLSRLGYQVEARRSAVDAWRDFAADPRRFPLVIADLSMPDMPGEELVRRIVECDRDVRVLICSGYPFDIASLPAAHGGRVGFLQKPFVPKMLAEAVENLLNAAP